MPVENCPIQTLDADSISCSIREHITHSLGKPCAEAGNRDVAMALSRTLRDRLVDKMLETRKRYRDARAKRMYYLSIEYLLGRCLGNNLYNMKIDKMCRSLVKEWGYDLEELREFERDPALGNGGLGRLAACFLDSLATLDMPGCGYGIHYEFGLFKQSIQNDRQVEQPDYWMAEGMPLQIERRDQSVIVPIYGRIESHQGPDGSYLPLWVDWQDLVGVPYDIPIVGFGDKTVNYLRLFAARSTDNFDMKIFDQGDYIKAIHQKVYSELVSKILYPSESISFGKELRLTQEYFLVFCSLRDITRRFLKQNRNIEELPEFIAIQLNDTHPALAVAELMRILVDERRVPWDRAWNITNRTLAFTNHTLMPESLEMWPVELMGKVLPRHLQIIYEINARFLSQIRLTSKPDDATLRRMSLIEEEGGKQVRMANLAVVGSHSVNGVSKLHSELVKTRLFPDYAALWPGKFNNKTNGITPRRWLYKANPGLAALITEAIGDAWIMDLDKLQNLVPLADDAAFQQKFLAVKRASKARLGEYVAQTTGVVLSPDAVFDMQAKRIHEYKRQLLNVMHVIHDYLRVTEDGYVPPVPRVYVFAGKAAPGYFEAKEIIHLICCAARIINNDKRAAGHIKMVFAADYRVSLAEKLIPAADVSEQISTAGTEASGTGNMKFSLNGALTIGTLDGANIEIREAVGAENFYLFGLTTPEVERQLGDDSYNPWEYYGKHPEIRRVLDALSAGRFTPDEPATFHWIFEKMLTKGERYMHLADFIPYLETHERLGMDYARPAVWARKAILNVARMGYFSADRTIREYARDIWGIKPIAPK
ncbi:glycogen/starch/alpha-glucan phosphorylase [Solidesulfovibrio sp. C21]|uniref:glycogen/starch/alpha-glucan phosphorylase n=1 Tax=Solidesulfovibrio sp. C21 TaxID=3398613 RepID=UPI0039FDC6E9